MLVFCHLLLVVLSTHCRRLLLLLFWLALDVHGFLYTALLIVAFGQHHGVLGELYARGVDGGEGELVVVVFVHIVLLVV